MPSLHNSESLLSRLRLITVSMSPQVKTIDNTDTPVRQLGRLFFVGLSEFAMQWFAEPLEVRIDLNRQKEARPVLSDRCVRVIYGFHPEDS